MFKQHPFVPRTAVLVLVIGLLLPFNLTRTVAASGGPQKPSAPGAPHVVRRPDVAKPSARPTPPRVYPGPVVPPSGPKTNRPKPSGTAPQPTDVTPAFSLSLASSNSGPQVNQSFTLTLTSDQDVGPTPYWLEIYYGNFQEASCGTGTTCSVILAGSPANVDYTFQGRVAYFDGSNVQAYSNPITVHIFPTFSVSLFSTNDTPGVNETYTLTASANQDVGPSPYYIRIYYGATSEVTCGAGTTCSVSLSNSGPGSYTYQARIESADSSLVEASSPSVTVTSRSAFTVSLVASTSIPHVTQRYTLTATANQDVGPTPYYIEIYQGSIQQVQCGMGTTCSISLAAGAIPWVGKTYQARIALLDGTSVQVTSISVTIWPQP